MSDKSPKEQHKLAEQKKHKDEAAQHAKAEITETLHHPVSGHPTTPEEALQEQAQAGAGPASPA